MQNETVTFDKLPEAVGYLTEQVIELKKMVSELLPPASDKHVLVEIEDACRIIRKAKPTIYTLVRKGLLPAYKKGKKLYFYEDELLAWIENGRRKTSEQTYEEMRRTGTDFPVSIFPTKIQRIISEVHECHSTSLQSYHPLRRWSYLY